MLASLSVQCNINLSNNIPDVLVSFSAQHKLNLRNNISDASDLFSVCSLHVSNEESMRLLDIRA